MKIFKVFQGGYSEGGGEVFVEASSEEVGGMLGCLRIVPSVYEGRDFPEKLGRSGLSRLSLIRVRLEQGVCEMDARGVGSVGIAFSCRDLWLLKAGVGAVLGAVSNSDFYTIVGVSKYTASSVEASLCDFFAGRQPDEIIVTGERLFRWAAETGGMFSCGWSPSGDSLIVTFRCGVVIWDLVAERTLRKVATGEPSVLANGWSPDGKLIGAVGRGGVMVRSGKTGDEILRLSRVPSRACAWSPGSSFFAAVGARGIRIWESSGFRQVMAAPVAAERGAGCAWSKDGTTFALCSNGKVTFWASDFQVEVLSLPDSFPSLWISTAWAPSLERFAVVGERYVAVGRPERDVVHLVGIISLPHMSASAWAEDGRRLALGGFDGRVHIWDVEHGSCLHRLSGHSDAVRDCSWSQDGDRLATASEDGTVRVWCTRSGECIFVLGRAGEEFFVYRGSGPGGPEWWWIDAAS